VLPFDEFANEAGKILASDPFIFTSQRGIRGKTLSKRFAGEQKHLPINIRHRVFLFGISLGMIAEGGKDFRRPYPGGNLTGSQRPTHRRQRFSEVRRKRAALEEIGPIQIARGTAAEWRRGR